MKMFVRSMILAVLMLSCYTTAHAWQVNVNNKTGGFVSVSVYGEHLFWRDQVDLAINNVRPNSSGSGSMPGAVCPFQVSINYYAERKYDPKLGWCYGKPTWQNIAFNVAHCTNTTITVSDQPNSTVQLVIDNLPIQKLVYQCQGGTCSK